MSVTLSQALELTPADGGLAARLDGGFSTAPQSLDPARGAPFGGLMAALAARAARQGLGVTAPLRTVSVQFLAAARFEDILLTPRLLRGGRSTAFTAVEAGQPGLAAISASATFGDAAAGPALALERTEPAPLDSAPTTPLDPVFGPWFTRHVEHRFVDGPGLFGLNAEPRLRLWMRTADGLPLDEARLCFLLDAVFPVYFTALPPPPTISATVDLRYDLFGAVEPDTAPDGWVWFEFATRQIGDGWALEDGMAWSASGRPLAAARQLRKLVPARR